MGYSLAPSEMSDYFSIDPDSGSVKTRRSLDTILPDQLPVRLTVLVTDSKENAHTASTSLVVYNILNQKNKKLSYSMTK